MNLILKQRAIMLGKHIAQTHQTVRQTALVFGISKSTVHNDVSNKLPYIDKKLFKKVKCVLDKNFAEKHLRGGESTKQKYLKNIFLNKK